MNIKRLLDTIRVETDALYWILLENLKSLGMKPEFEHDDWIYVDNASPIMLVAHIDTVTRNKKLKFRVKRDRIRARNSVLGADDRAGIYAIMEILDMCKDANIPMPSILFTNYEECGLIGVEAFVKAKKMEKNMNIFIELDRKGKDEYVYYFHGMPREVATWVESFGFIKDSGSMSDVMILTEEYNVPHVNLSVGYYDQHSTGEMLRPSELQLTIDRVFQMIQNPLEELHEVDGKLYDPYEEYYGYGMYGYNKPINRGWKNDYNMNTGSVDIINYSNNIVPKSYTYCDKTDVLMEVDYELDTSDIPWEDDYTTPDIIDGYFEESPNERNETIMSMSDEKYYGRYGWEY